MPAGDKLKPKSTREHLLSIYGYITGIKKDMKHMHEGIHDLGGKIDKIYWVVLGTVGAVSLLLLEKVIDKLGKHSTLTGKYWFLSNRLENYKKFEKKN